MISKIKFSLFLVTFIAFLLSATLGFSSTQTLVTGDNGKVPVLMNDIDDKDDEDDKDEDINKLMHKDKDDDDEDEDEDDKDK